MEGPKFKIAIIGATGAIGKELVRLLGNDNRVSELALLVRRKLPEWDEMENTTPDFKEKAKYLIMENFDDLAEKLADNEVSNLDGYDAFLCTLGTRVKVGKEQFIKVDYQYPIDFATYGRNHNIKYFGHLSSQGAKSSSCMLYMKTKGEVEEALQKLGLNHLSIYRPALLLNRDNDKRLGESIGSMIPFIPKIESKDVAKAIISHCM